MTLTAREWLLLPKSEQMQRGKELSPEECFKLRMELSEIHFTEEEKQKMTKEELQLELKALIVSALGLEDIKPEDIETDAPLFVDGLGLDSIDALELGLAIKKKYGITMSAENEENKKHFASVAALADFIAAHKAAA